MNELKEIFKPEEFKKHNENKDFPFVFGFFQGVCRRLQCDELDIMLEFIWTKYQKEIDKYFPK